MASGLKLNLGCGHRKMSGYVNVDRDPHSAPDMVVDLEALPWPFEPDSVAEVQMLHVLEHLGRDTDTFTGIISELYRICRDNALVRVMVPHHRSDSFTSDPTHVRPITPQTLSMFSKDYCRAFAEQGWSNTRLAEMIDVDFGIAKVEYMLTADWRERLSSGTVDMAGLNYAIRSYNNVVEQIDFELRVVKSVGTQDAIGRTSDGNLSFVCC